MDLHEHLIDVGPEVDLFDPSFSLDSIKRYRCIHITSTKHYRCKCGTNFTVRLEGPSSVSCQGCRLWIPWLPSYVFDFYNRPEVPASDEPIHLRRPHACK